MSKLTLTTGQLTAILKQDDDELASKWLEGINKCLERFEINTPLRTAHFLSQIAHESGNFKHVEENLNYSAKALRTVFGKYFDDDAHAEQYHRKPKQIASRVYANRMGNGDEESGEGWEYRGRGLIQLTGKENYQKFSEACGEDVVAYPDLIPQRPDLCVLTAGWYWDSRGLNSFADDDDIRQITRRINGGYNGLEDRQSKLDHIKSVLGI